VPTFSRRRSFAFASVIVLFLLGTAECALRVIGIRPPVEPRIILRLMDTDITLPFIRADEDVFWSPQPGYGGEFMGKRVTINTLGLRGPEIAPARPPGGRRVACFGDSITFGYGVGDDETYPHFLGAELAPYRVEVVNAGVTGFTSHQVVGFLRRLAPRLAPDVATFCIGWNDGNRRPVDDREYARRLRMVGSVEGTLDHLYLYRSMKTAYLRAAALKGLDTGQGAERKGYRVTLPQYRENLETIVRECRQRGIRPVFVALPRRKRTGEPGPDAPYAAALVQAGRDLGVAVLDAGDLGLGTRLDHPEGYFIDALHLSPEGNRLMAALLARQLLANDLL
jgi:lysophospholipase L1-like esterase